jgi:hypothetical protein
MSSTTPEKQYPQIKNEAIFNKTDGYRTTTKSLNSESRSSCIEFAALRTLRSERVSYQSLYSQQHQQLTLGST